MKVEPPLQQPKVKLPVDLGQQLADELQAKIAKLKTEINYLQGMMMKLSTLERVEEVGPNGKDPSPLTPVPEADD